MLNYFGAKTVRGWFSTASIHATGVFFVCVCFQTPGLLHLWPPSGVPDSWVTWGGLPEEPLADPLQEPREASGISERGETGTKGDISVKCVKINSEPHSYFLSLTTLIQIGLSISSHLNLRAEESSIPKCSVKIGLGILLITLFCSVGHSFVHTCNPERVSMVYIVTLCISCHNFHWSIGADLCRKPFVEQWAWPSRSNLDENGRIVFLLITI